MEIHIRVIGVVLIGLAFVHVIFPKYFNWKEELPQLSLINQQLMTVHTFFIALTVFLIGVLCVSSAPELVHTKLGHTVSLGFAIFGPSVSTFSFLVTRPNYGREKHSKHGYTFYFVVCGYI